MKNTTKNLLRKIIKEEIRRTIANSNKRRRINEESYTVAGRPVTLIKGKKADGTDWKVKFQNGKETPLSDVLSLIKPFPKLDKESVNENLTARIMKKLKETKSKKNR